MRNFRRKFHIGFINHNKNPILQAGVQNPAHLTAGNCRGGGIVWITENQKIQLVRQSMAEIIYMDGKIHLLF